MLVLDGNSIHNIINKSNRKVEDRLDVEILQDHKTLNSKYILSSINSSYKTTICIELFTLIIALATGLLFSIIYQYHILS